MTKALSILKGGLLVAALSIVGISMVSDTVQATTCEGAGHSCHLFVGSDVFHYLEIP